MLHVGAGRDLIVPFAVHADFVDLALVGLTEDALAVLRPGRGAAGFFGLELAELLAGDIDEEDADLTEVAAGDGYFLAVGAKRGDAAPFPGFGSNEAFLAGVEIANEGLVVADEDDRFAAGGPVGL